MSKSVSVNELDIGNGIDTESPLPNIQEGYFTTLDNLDVVATGGIRKRKGFEVTGGSLPIPVLEAKQDGTSLQLTLPFVLDVSLSNNHPVLVRGRTSITTGGEFDETETESYYSGFLTSILKDVANGSGTISVPQEEHRKESTYLHVSAFREEGSARANSNIVLGSYIVDTLTGDITISYNNGDPAFSSYIGITEFSGTGTYVDEFLSVNGVDQQLVIPAATHNLATADLITALWYKSGTDLIQCLPDSCQIEPNGDVTFTVTTDSATDFVIGLAEVSTIESGEMVAGETKTISLDITSPFNLVECFLEPTIGGTIEQILPDSYEWANDSLSVTFVNNGTSTARFYIKTLPVLIETSKLILEATTSATWEDLSPDMAVWGIIGEGSLPAAAASSEQTFWCHWLDTYSAEGNRFPVAAIMGRACQRSTDDTVLLRPRMTSRVSADSSIGPLIGLDTGTTPNHRIQVSETLSGGVQVDSITWTVSGVEVVCFAPDVSVIEGPEIGASYLTIVGATNEINNGTFLISGFSLVDSSHIKFVVNNDSLIDSLWDEQETGAIANSYSDSVPVTDEEIFLSGDLVSGTGLELSGLSVSKQDGTTLYLEGARELQDIPAGLRLRATRTLSVLPLASLDGTPISSPIVPGDSILITGENRNIRITDVRSQPTEAVTISCDLESLVGTITVSDSSFFRIGSTISLFGELTKEVVVVDAPTATTLTYDLDEETETSYSTMLMGHCVTIDETLTKDWTSDTFVTRPYRWFPISNISYQDLPKSLDFTGKSPDSQPIVRSTMSRDSLFLTNGSDPVLKFDGLEIGRAGLPRWQADLFMRADSSGAAKIVVNNPVATYASFSGSVLTFSSPEDAGIYLPGQEISFVGFPDATYVVQSVNTTTGNIQLDKNIPAAIPATGDIVGVHRLSYYARVWLKDRNGGDVTGAVVGEVDMSIVLTADAGVEFKFLNFPKLDSYSYENLTLSLYRAKSTSPAGPYYEITNIPLSAETTYVYFRDSTPDVALTKLDPVSTGLEGVELGTQWEGPLRSESVGSIGGQLVLANCTGWPVIDLVLNRGNNAPLSNGSDMTGTITVREDNELAGGQVFEFVSNSTTTIFTAGVPDVAIAADSYIYLFRTVDDSPLEEAGWHQVDGSGNLGTINGTYEVSIGSSPANIPIFVTGPSDTTLDTNWPAQENLSAEGRALQRLSGAINWWQAGLGSAWLTTAAGGSFERDQIRFLQPVASNTTFEIEIAGLNSRLTPFANGLNRGTSYPVQISAFTDVFKSRVLLSEVNFPDLFNSPQTSIDLNSRNVFDINPDDGQEVTGVATFFGVATTSAAQKQRALVIFKEASIYVLDIVSGTYQRLETEGKGCSIRGSIVATRGGIQFANNSGIYRLGPDMEITYVGRKYEGIWRNPATDKTYGAGTYWKFENKYLLSHDQDSAAVFHTTRESQSGIPAVSSYSSVDSLMFSNFNDSLFYASRRGVILKSRESGELTDYRDEANSIPITATSRPHHFGEPSIRKVVGGVISHLKVPESGASLVEMGMRVDIGGNMEPADSITLAQVPSYQQPNSFYSILSSPSQSRGVFFQVQWSTDEKDRGFELAFYGMEVYGLSSAGITQAAETP